MGSCANGPTWRCTPAPQTRAPARGPHERVVKCDELGHALSWRRDILTNERTFSLGHVCAALDVDPGDKSRLVARVEDLKRRMRRME